jgi:HK97 family phage major capsid protein
MTTNLTPFLSPKERKSYSLARAILASDSRNNVGRCLESEVSDSVRFKFAGTAAGGVIIPPEIMFGTPEQFAHLASGTRTLVAGNGPEGGYTIAGETAPLLAYLHPQSKILTAGGEIIPLMPVGQDGSISTRSDVALPVETVSSEAEWLNEGETATGGSSTFAAAMLRAKRFYASRSVSKQLLAQSELSRRLERMLMAAVAAAIDRGGLAGIGGKQPLGLLNNSQVTTVPHGADGGAPTATTLTSHVTPVIQANAPMLRPGWIISPKVRAKAALTPIFSNTAIPLSVTMSGRDQLIGFHSAASTLMPDTLTKGNGTALGSAIFGDWSQIIVALWPMLQINSDPYGANAKAGLVDVWIDGFADVAAPRPTCFSKSVDIVTT